MYGRVLFLSLRGPQLEPCGVDGLTQAEAAMLFYSNCDSEFVAWFAAQALQCSVRKIVTILLFPEDLGSDQCEGLASVWQYSSTGPSQVPLTRFEARHFHGNSGSLTLTCIRPRFGSTQAFHGYKL